MAEAPGWELTGPMGPSRLAWKNGKLWAEELAGTRYDPAVVLLDARSGEATATWSGLVSVGAKALPATARLEQVREEQTLAGRTYKTLRATLTLEFDEGRTELITWYSQGIGPLRQEQRDDGVLTHAIEYQSGP